jgi:hypothetical protein
MFKRLRWWVIDMWQPVLIGLLIASFVVLLFTFQLSSLTGGLSQPEIDYVNSASSLARILDEPVFLPHKLLTYIAVKVNYSDALFRLPSVIFSLATIISGLVVMRSIFSRKTTIMAGIVLVSSSWLLSVGRLALPHAAFLIAVPAFALCYWFYKSYKRFITLPIIIAALTSCIYVPAFIWLIIGLIIQQRKTIKAEMRYIPSWYLVMCLSIVVIMLAPLAYASLRSTDQLLLILGLPADIAAVKNFPSNLLQVLKDIFVINSSGPIYTVGRTALLDVFTSVLVVLGAYSQRFERTGWKLTLAVIVVFYLIFIALGGPVSSAILLPFIYLLAAYGLAFLMSQWFTVFPRNPIARSFGTIMVTVSMLLVAFYHVNKYYVAWPNTPDTRRSFNQSLIK